MARGGRRGGPGEKQVTKSTTVNSATWPDAAAPVKRRTVVMPPGPARSRIAREKRRSLLLRTSPPSCFAHAQSHTFPREGRAKTMSRGRRKDGRTAGDAESRQPDAEGLERHVAHQGEQERVWGRESTATLPLLADSPFCFSEKPRVSAAKMGARPSGSTTTGRVTKALNANSIGTKLYLTAKNLVLGMTRHSPRNDHARPMVFFPIRPLFVR